MAAGRVTSFLRHFVGMVILADFTDLIDMNEKFEFKIQHVIRLLPWIHFDRCFDQLNDQQH